MYPTCCVLISFLPSKWSLFQNSLTSQNTVVNLGLNTRSSMKSRFTSTLTTTKNFRIPTCYRSFKISTKSRLRFTRKKKGSNPKKLIFHYQFLTLPYTISLHRRNDPPEIICFKSDLPQFIVHHVMIYTTSSLQEFLCFILQLSTHLHKHWAGPSGGQSAPINQTCARPQILCLLKWDGSN